MKDVINMNKIYVQVRYYGIPLLSSDCGGGSSWKRRQR